MLKLLTLFFAISFTAFGASYVDPANTLNKKGIEFGMKASAYAPTSFVTFNGENTNFEEGESYFNTDLMLDLIYGFTDRLQLGVGANFRFVQSTNTYAGEEKSLNAGGLESALFSVKYSFPVEKKLQYAFEFNYRIATYSNEYYEPDEVPETPDIIAVGDSSRDISFGMSYSYRTESNNFFGGRVLYRNPGDRLSSEIFSEIEMAFVWQYFSFILGVENIYSLGQDAYTDDEANKPVLSRASSPEYNSINRSWTAPYIGINFGLGKQWRLELQSKTKLWGNSTTLGSEFQFNLIRRVSSSNEFASKDSAFKEYRMEGSVIKVSKSKRAASIDFGLEAGLEKGGKVDFYLFDYLEGNKLIASGYAVKVGTKKAIVKITKRYSKDKLKAGVIARAGLIK